MEDLRAHFPRRPSPYALLVVAIAASFCSASPLPRAAALQPISRQLSTPQCTFTGNSDLYGLGIRIGIYLQWISGLLANSFHADSVQDMLATNTIFLIALFIALAISTVNDTVVAAEVAILLQFCFGFLFTVSSTWGLRITGRQLNSAKEYKKRVHFPLMGSTVRLCLATAICAYNVWFWFVGVGRLSGDTCHPMGFLFAPIDLLRRARVFFKITSVMFVSFLGTANLSEVVLLVCNWVFYSFIAGFIAVLIAFHRGFHSDGSPKQSGADEGELENAKKTSNVKNNNRVRTRSAKIMSTFVALTKYSPVVMGGIPWVMMNGDIGVGFKRLQSWVIIAIMTLFILLCIVILLVLVLDVIVNWGSALFAHFLQGIEALWVFCKMVGGLSPFHWLRVDHIAAQTALQPSRTPSPSISQQLEVEKDGEVIENLAEDKREAAVGGHPQATLSFENAAQAESSSADALSGESSKTAEHITANKISILERETLDRKNSDGEKLAEHNLEGKKPGSIEPLHSATTVETLPNNERLRCGHTGSKSEKLPQLAVKFWKKLGDYEDYSSQTPSWGRRVLAALPAINLACAVWSILSIELMIRWNKVTEVHTIQSVGQLIPFVIGIVGFFKLLRDISIQSTQLWIYRVVLVSYNL